MGFLDREQPLLLPPEHVYCDHCFERVHPHRPNEGQRSHVMIDVTVIGDERERYIIARCQALPSREFVSSSAGRREETEGR